MSNIGNIGNIILLSNYLVMCYVTSVTLYKVTFITYYYCVTLIISIT
jgi:hypothetical protein